MLTLNKSIQPMVCFVLTINNSINVHSHTMLTNREKGSFTLCIINEK